MEEGFNLNAKERLYLAAVALEEEPWIRTDRLSLEIARGIRKRTAGLSDRYSDTEDHHELADEILQSAFNLLRDVYGVGDNFRTDYLLNALAFRLYDWGQHVKRRPEWLEKAGIDPNKARAND